jgi:hypothetical protein
MAVFGIACISLSSAFSAQERIRFKDGSTLAGEVLFEHPNAPLLIVRAPDYSGLQSFLLSDIAERGLPINEAEEESQAEPARKWVTHVGSGQIGNYAQQRWEPKKVLVWAHPGESGNASDPQNWLDENGQPYPAMPWGTDMATSHKGNTREAKALAGDLLLPYASEKYAALQPGNRDHLGTVVIRHLTIENGGSYQVRYTIEGNLWMKPGSRLGKGTQDGGFGNPGQGSHTVARFENAAPDPEFPEQLQQPLWAYADHISHWVFIDAGENGSREIIGVSGGAGDRLTVMTGTLIVAEDSYLGNGNRGCFYLMEGAKTILLDGAKVGCAHAIVSKGRATYGIVGELHFGTPEHPLKRNFDFGLTYFREDEIDTTGEPSQRTSGASFVLGKTGKMMVHSSDPQQIKVRFVPRPEGVPVSQYVVPRTAWDYITRRDKKFFGPQPELWKQEGVPNGVAALFLGEADLNGVHFDHFYTGGIIVSEAQRRQWQNGSFGDENHAEGEALFREP